MTNAYIALFSLVALWLGTAVQPAAAQTKSGQSQVFTPDYFTEFAPHSAEDMVSRIPGFVIESAEDKRGLGQGGANVLINGARIAGKTGVFDTLARINAGNVVRIEILDGASTDIPGLNGDIANIVTKNTGVSGTFEWEPEFRHGVRPSWLNAGINISGERGDFGYSLELENNSNRRRTIGSEFLLSPDETLFERRDEESTDYNDGPSVSLDVNWNPANEHAANLNVEFTQTNRNDREDSDRTAITSDGRTLKSVEISGEDEWEASIGADYQFPLGPGQLKLIAYSSFERSPRSRFFDAFNEDTSLSDTQFNRLTKEGERIARAEYSWANIDGHDWQIAAEGAFNFFDTTTIINRLQGDGTFSNNDASLERVEERRVETNLTYSRPFGSYWQLQSSVGAEYSELIQVGISAADRTQGFFRPKGFVSATYSPDDTHSIRLRLERKVGQLNFSDFISSVTLDDDLDTVANPNLVPDQRWTGEIEYDLLFMEDNTFKITAFGEIISDLVDRIPIRNTNGVIVGDGVGNIENAYGYGIIAESTLQGDYWGLAGTELELFADLRQSSLTDPLTGLKRELSSDRWYHLEANFRHDIQQTDWAYGVSASFGRNFNAYRLSSKRKRISDRPSMDVFLEHKDVYGLKINFTLENLTGVHVESQTNFFDPRRDMTGVLERIERRDFTGGRRLILEVSGTF